MRKSQYEKRKAALSKNAAKLLGRLETGLHYYAWKPAPHKAMQELIEAGLVVSCGRPVVFRSCWVPARGFTPYRPERFETASNQMVKP